MTKEVFKERIPDPDGGNYAYVEVIAQDNGWITLHMGDYKVSETLSLPIAKKLHEALGKAIEALEKKEQV